MRQALGNAEFAVLAEVGTDEARQFVRRVRRATRRELTPEEKVGVVLEGFRRVAPVSVAVSSPRSA
jgi:hypothetical protein